METKDIHAMFITALENKIQKKTMLADKVAEILCIEKETAYRRLRGEVQFSLREAILIAARLNVSIDDILAKEYSYKRKKTPMYIPGRYQMEILDLWPTKEEVTFLEVLSTQTRSEMGVAAANIPSALYISYSLIARFILLKYQYHNDQTSVKKTFKQIKEPTVQEQYRDDFHILFRKIKHTFYVWDRSIISNITKDIKYFNTIGLIDDDELPGLKKELFSLLNDLEQSAIREQFKETGHKFELYLSDLYIDTTYAYFCSEQINVGMYTSFLYLNTASEEIAAFECIKRWVNSTKSCSTLISGVNERERIRFFDEQRSILETL